MGLLNKSNDAPSFEADEAAVIDNTKTVVKEAGDTKADAKTVKSEQKPGSAVAVKSQGEVGAALAVSMRKLETFRDALRVEYNTLAQMTAQQGNIIDRESKVVLGDTVVFELLSYQDSFVVSPEDDDAPDDVVRYSEDGKVCTDGTDVEEHLNWLKENGFPKAKLKQRVVVVGAIESASKTDTFNGTLVQFDLSPASRVQWMRYLANAAYALKVGKFNEEEVKRVKAETKLSQGGGNNTYTLVQFSVAG